VIDIQQRHTQIKPPKKLRLSAIRELFRRFGSHVLHFRRPLLGAVLCMLGVTLTELIRPWPLKYIFDGVLIPSISGVSSTDGLAQAFALSTQALAAVAAAAIVVIAIINGLFTFGQTNLTAKVAQGVTASIRHRVYSHLQHLSRSFHDQRRTGDLMVRLTGDVRLVQEMLVTSAMQLADRLLLIVFMIAIMCWLDWKLTIIAVAIIPVLLVVIVLYTRRIKAAAKNQRKRESEIASEMTEKLSAITLIQAFSRQAHEQEQFSQHNENSVEASLTSTRLEAHLGRTVQVIIAIGVGLVIWFGVSRVQLGALSAGELLVFVSYMTGMYKPLRKLASTTSRTIKATVSGERLIGILDAEMEIKDAPDAIGCTSLQGDIQFKGVTFSYRDSTPVLNDADIHIQPGEHIALLGESGAGKSTIAHLLLRLYDPVSGSIFVDNQDIRNYQLTSLREQIALVLQEPMLFRSTIKENIAYGRLAATQAEIESAATAANAHDFIAQLPDGYDTVIGERGDTLSGGQKQRIAIARALIRHASIVILDEPVSGLDPENRKEVERALRKLTQNRTCITITHDLATAQKAQRVLKVESGRIHELSKERLDQTSDFDLKSRTSGTDLR